MPTSSATKTILTAAHWGPMLVETDGENVLSSRGALATPFANSLQTAVRDQVHSKTRVRYPMVRKGFLASPDHHYRQRTARRQARFPVQRQIFQLPLQSGIQSRHHLFITTGRQRPA